MARHLFISHRRVLARGGRIESPAGSGELKKQIQMVAEGSVIYAPSGPFGSAQSPVGLAGGVMLKAS